MDAIVLVGGQGTRLRPLTYDLPKQMLPIVDRPLIRHVVAWLGRCGVDRAVLSLGYRPDAFTDAFPDGEIDGVELAYAVEEEPLGTAGAIRFAAHAGGVEGRFLVLNGDVLTDFDATRLVRFHGDHGAGGSLYLTPVADPSAFGLVETDPDGRVTAFIEKPAPGTATTNLINAGVYVLEASVLDRIPEGRAISIERETFPLLAAEGTLFAVSSNDYWIDTGTPWQYIRAQLDILQGARDPFSLPAAPQVRPGIFASRLSPSVAQVAGVAYLGEGATITAGASVTDTVLGDGAAVHDSSRVERSIVMAGAVIGRGCVVEDSVVGPGAVIGDHCCLSGLTVVRGGCTVPAETTLVEERFETP
jgi:mannose-1-phosphate guanylyltransferase